MELKHLSRSRRRNQAVIRPAGDQSHRLTPTKYIHHTLFDAQVIFTERTYAVVSDVRRGSIMTTNNRTEITQLYQIRARVGGIRIAPTVDGSLEAVMQGRYAGVLKLAAGRTLINVVAGTRFARHFLRRCALP